MIARGQSRSMARSHEYHCRPAEARGIPCGNDRFGPWGPCSVQPGGTIDLVNEIISAFARI